MKVWVTKYALSQGIFEIDVTDCGGGMVKELSTWVPVYYHGEGNDWHKTKESAIVKAEDMRQKKIISLRKKIEKLEKMKF